MGAIERILERLARDNDLVWEREGDVVRVLPLEESGFEVAVVHQNGVWTVILEGWFEEFATEEEAAQCVSFALSDACRLWTWERRGLAFRWTVEALVDGEWVAARTVGMLLAPMIRVDVRCRSNGVVILQPDAAELRA